MLRDVVTVLDQNVISLTSGEHSVHKTRIAVLFFSNKKKSHSLYPYL